MRFEKQESIYEQIAEAVKENILSGRWCAEERIPSVRELAGELEVNPNTVMRTYQLLNDENVIYNKRGVGYFVTSCAQDEILKNKIEEFNQKVLPDLFQYMEQLNISMEELNHKYKEWKQ